MLSKNENENENENEHEIDGSETAFENFIQGIHNIDTAMEAMIDNYTDGVEHLSEENKPSAIKPTDEGSTASLLDKIIHDNNKIDTI